MEMGNETARAGVAEQERAAELRAQIQRANDLYYNRTRRKSPDAAYDALQRELRLLEEKFPNWSRQTRLPRRSARETVTDFPPSGTECPCSSLTMPSVRTTCVRGRRRPPRPGLGRMCRSNTSVSLSSTASRSPRVRETAG